MSTKEPKGTMAAGEHQEVYQEHLAWLLPGLPWKDDQPHGPGGVTLVSSSQRERLFLEEGWRTGFPQGKSSSLEMGKGATATGLWASLWDAMEEHFGQDLAYLGKRAHTAKEGTKAVWRGTSMAKQGQGKGSQLNVSRGIGHCVYMVIPSAWSLKSLTTLERLHSVLMSVHGGLGTSHWVGQQV